MRVLKRVDESLTRSTLSVVLVSFWRPPGGGNEQANVSGDATADDVLPPRPRLMPRPWPSAGPPMLMTPPVVPSSRKWFDMSKKGTRPSASAGTKTRIRIRRGAEKDTIADDMDFVLPWGLLSDPLYCRQRELIVCF